ncbi:flavodoxin family protein [Enterococcus sp. AZ109]|uniref:flavodoxin family protein n=1 Tax=Enterococcus sp. AZ109 TaxID=2774634 RepID=UPI003F224945
MKEKVSAMLSVFSAPGEYRGSRKNIMKKKILVITGSPRRHGNSWAMTDAFIETAEANGHSITRFDVGLSKIGGCVACEKCFSKENQACVYNDDFNKIAPFIQEADAVVFSTPLYWYSFPGQIKNFIDKIYSFVVGQKDIAGKACGLMACCEDHDISALDGIRFPYEKTIGLLKWESVGEVLIPGVFHKGEINATDGLQRASALADAL